MPHIPLSQTHTLCLDKIDNKWLENKQMEQVKVLIFLYQMINDALRNHELIIESVLKLLL